MPWADGLPGCTNSEAWPISPEVYNLMMTRPGNDDLLWASREPDWMRSALGAGRSTTNVTQTMSFTFGLEGDLPSGDHSWDISLYTGRSDNTVNQLGSMRLTTYRDVLSSPNFGRNATFDSNPWEAGGFAESIPTCTSGLPVADDRAVSADCLQMISPALKNVREMTQTIFEANLVGDLAEMRDGPLSYALGIAYRENGFEFVPDNLSDIQNEVDPIAGLFPNEASAGEFDVAEIYGELLIPIISDGRTGVEHFNLELGGRVSDWSMEQMPNLNTYKALIDWGITPRYRIRGGFNRAFRAPNLGELFIRRTQVFGGFGARATGARRVSPLPATSARRRGVRDAGAPQQVAQSLAHLPAIDGRSGCSVLLRPHSHAGHRRRYRRLEHVRQPELARGAGRHVDDRRRHGHSRGLPADGRLVADRDREHDLGRKRRRHVPGLLGPRVQPDRRSQQRGLSTHQEESNHRRWRPRRSSVHELGRRTSRVSTCSSTGRGSWTTAAGSTSTRR